MSATQDSSSTGAMSATQEPVSTVAMSATQEPLSTDVTTPVENSCAYCKKHYYISSPFDNFFRDTCMLFLQLSEPKTEKEIELEKVVRNFTDDDLKAVGLGVFFELEDPPTAAQAQYTTTSPPARPSSSSYEAQMSALNSQLTHQRKISDGNVSTTSDSTKTPSASPLPLFQLQVQRSPPSYGMTSVGPGPVTKDMIRQWAFHNHGGIPATTAGHSRSSSTPFPRPSMESQGEIFGSPSVQVQANKTRKRGKRMICATCKKDSPVSAKNDGVNCTRCFAKLQKSEAAVTVSPDFGGVKRSYEGTFGGYSPADGSPFKRSR